MTDATMTDALSTSGGRSGAPIVVAAADESPAAPTDAPGHAAGPKTPAFAAFGVANYRRFVSGQAISLIGSWTETIAQGVLILGLTGSPVMLGLATAARYLPVLLFTPYAGVIVDRRDKRRTLMLTQALLGVVSVAFGASVLLHTVAIWQVFAAALAFGFLTALDNPARMALIPEIVGRSLIRNAVTLNSTFANVGRGLGPVVAAALIGTVGVGWCFVANGVSFALVVLALATLRIADLHPAAQIARQRGQLREGLRFARHRADILGPLAMMAFIGTFTYEFEVSLPVFGEQSLNSGLNGYGWLTAAFGLGAVVGWIALVIRPQTGLRRMMVITVAYGLSVTGTALSPSLPVALAGMVLVGACSIGFLTTGNSTIQLEAPPSMRGRVTSLWTTAFTGSTPIGASVVVGVVAAAFGGRAALAVGGVACFAAVAAGAVILVTMRPAPQETADRAASNGRRYGRMG